MKKISAFFLVALFACSSAHAASLYETYSREASVPFYVESVTDSSKDKKADIVGLKAAIEKAFTERKSIHFKPVTDPKDAKIKITVDVKNYYWSDHDPVDMLVGVGATAMDAAMIEDYAFMEADAKIMDAKGSPLWSQNLISTVTKKPMSPEQALPLINEDFAKNLLKNAFSKKQRQ
jgi:hypothetical protein